MGLTEAYAGYCEASTKLTTAQSEFIDALYIEVDALIAKRDVKGLREWHGRIPRTWHVANKILSAVYYTETTANATVDAD